MTKNPIILALLLILYSLLLFASQANANSSFPGADPDIISDSNYYRIYATNADGVRDDCFYTYTSTNLIDWNKSSPILNLNHIKWANDDGKTSHSLWAPCVFRRDGKWYLYFSVGPQGETPSRIGVAECILADGHFVDSGHPLVTGGGGFEAIDPMVFRDPVSGKVHLFCGGSAGSTLHVYELNDDLISIKSQIAVETPKDFTEGAYMHFYNGKYYLSYSHGRWNDNSYCVCYSTATSPTGPWTYGGKILQGDGHFSGPGHHAFFQNPSNGLWYIVYHRWDGPKVTPSGHSRGVAIDLVRYGANGCILPIKMTDDGVAPVPLEAISNGTGSAARPRTMPTLPKGSPILDNE